MRPKLENSQFFALFFSILFQYGSFLDLNLHKISNLDDMPLQLCWLPLKTPFQSEVCNTSIFKLPDPNVILLMLEHESLYEKEAYLDYTTEGEFPTALAWDQPDFFEREV